MEEALVLKSMTVTDIIIQAGDIFFEINSFLALVNVFVVHVQKRSRVLEYGPFKLELIQLVFKIIFVANLYRSDFVFIIGFCGQRNYTYN